MQGKALVLRILTVALKLKFKCRLKLEWKDNISTKEAASNDGIFTLHQDLEIYPKTNQIQLLVSLLTDKGSKYNGGVIKFTIEQLKKRAGTVFKFPISKCIDRQSWIEMKVLQFPQTETQYKVRKDMSFRQKHDTVVNFGDNSFTPQKNKKANFVYEPNLGQTKSEHCFPLPTSSIYMQDNQQKNDTKRQMFGDYSNIRMNKQKKNARGLSPKLSSFHRESPDQWVTQRQQQHQAKYQTDISVSKCKKTQQKLREEQQKYRGELQKRRFLQSQEQSYKMEIVRLQIAKDESDKQQVKKQNKIKQLNAQISQLKQWQKKALYQRQQLRKKAIQITFLEDKLRLQGNQHNQIKTTTQMEVNKYQFDISCLKKQHQKFKKDKNEFTQQLNTKLKKAEEALNLAQNKLDKVQQQLQRQKRNSINTENKSNLLIKDLQKSINDLKKQSKIQKEQSNETILKLERQKSNLNSQAISLREQSQKLKIQLSKITVQKRTFEEKFIESQQGLSELKKYKDKYQQQVQKYKSAKEQYSKMKRKYEVSVEQNRKLEEMFKTNFSEIERHTKSQQKSEEKIKMYQQKIKDYEVEVKEVKYGLDKYRKSQESLQKQMANLKQKQKQLRTQLNKKEVQVVKLTSDYDHLNIRFAQMRQHSKMDQSKRFNSSYIQDPYEQTKVNSMIETQRFLEMQIISHKQTYSQVQGQLNRMKQELDKWAKLQLEWKEQQRNLESEKGRLSSQNVRLARQSKQFVKRFGQEQSKNMSLNDKVEKQKKNVKLLQQKISQIQSTLKKIIDQKQDILSTYQVRQNKLKTTENQLSLMRRQIDFRQNEKKKFCSANESFQVENKKLKEQIIDLTFRLREEQERYATENKRMRQEMNKYEVKLINYKRQSEKFKENLRNILVESIITKLPKDQQDFEIILKKKEEKLGLTLTNQLLIKLEQYLKELHRYQTETEIKLQHIEKQLIGAREETILKTNQFQNTEGQLKNKLDQLIDNLDKMKKIYEEREDELRKSLNQSEWQVALNNDQINKLNELIEKQNHDKIQLNENFVKKQIFQNSEIQKLKSRTKELQENELRLNDQITSLQQYTIKIEQNLSESRKKQQDLELQVDKMKKDIVQFRNQIEVLTVSNQQMLRHRYELKNSLCLSQSQVQQMKILADQYQRELQAYEKQKNENTGMARNLMKQKQGLLHQYLASQENYFALQTKQFELEENYNQLNETNTKNNFIIEQLKQYKKKASAELKNYQNITQKRQSDLKQCSEKLKQKEKLLIKLQDRTQQLQGSLTKERSKWELTNRNLSQKCSQLQQLLENSTITQNKLSINIQELNKQNIQLEQLRRSLKQVNEQISFNLIDTQQKLAQAIEASQQNQSDLFISKSQLAQLKQQLAKVKIQIEEKDMKNFMLSSQIYKVESESVQKMEQLQEKITLQEQSMLKYEQICQQNNLQIQFLKKQRDNLSDDKVELTQELNKIALKFKSIEQQSILQNSTNQKLELELERMRQSKAKLQSLKNTEERQVQQKLYALQEKSDKKDIQIQKLKNQNQVLHETIKKLDQKLKQNDNELQQMMKKCSNEIETCRKSQNMLKKYRENLKQLQWSNERQAKKLVQNKIRCLNEIQNSDIEQNMKLGDHLKGFEEGIIEILRKYQQL